MSVEVGGVQKGWTVYGADGKKVGDIDEVYPTYLKLHKGLIFRRDIFVPAMAIGQLRGNEVHLTVPQGEIDALGWDSPPFATGGRSGDTWATVQRMPPEPDVAPLVDRVFSREALRIPIRGEQVTVEKTAVITGEVAITKEREFERTPVQTTVRRVEVEVEEQIEEERDLVRREQQPEVGRREGQMS